MWHTASQFGKKIRRRPPSSLVIFVALLLLSGLTGYLLGHSSQKEADASYGPIRKAHSAFHLVAPLLACEFPLNSGGVKTQQLKSIVENDIATAKRSDIITDASVYMRALDSGENLSVNPDLRYDPASMIKVVLMIVYAHAAEADPSIITKQLNMTNDVAVAMQAQQYYGSTTLVVGQSYRIADLIDLMIKDSDNAAKDLLIANIPTDVFIRTLTDISMAPPTGDAKTLLMSPKEIAPFFLLLYNATYLTEQHSEIALELLTKTKFNDGIVAGVPYGVTIAHKFGEFVLPAEGKNRSYELHDCGIVYASGAPYFLCVMTRGRSHAELGSLIEQISRDVYYSQTSPQQ